MNAARVGEIEGRTSANNNTHTSSPSLSTRTLQESNSTAVYNNFNNSIYPVHPEHHQIQLILDPQGVAGGEIADQQHQLPLFESIFYDSSSGNLENPSAVDEANGQLLYSTEFIVQDGQVILADPSNPIASDNQLDFQKEQQSCVEYQYYQSQNELLQPQPQVFSATNSQVSDFVLAEAVEQQASSPAGVANQSQKSQQNPNPQSQSRRRARKTDPKGLPRSTVTEVQSSYPLVEASTSQIVVEKNAPKKKVVRKSISKNAIQQSCIRFGFLPSSKAADKKPFYIPSTIYRWPDERRNISVLPPRSVVLRFCKLDKNKRQKSPAFLAANLLASNGEKFCRVLLGSDFENLNQESLQYNLTTLLLKNADLNPVQDSIPANNLIIPKNTLIIRHPLLRIDQASPVYCAFPVEQVEKDGTRVHVIQRTVIQRSIEAGRIEISSENEVDIKTYLGSLPPSENGMEQQNNQFYNCFFQSDGSLHAQPASENRNHFTFTTYAPMAPAPSVDPVQVQLFPSNQNARVFCPQGISSSVQQSNYANQQGPINIVYTLQPPQSQMPLTFISHQQQQIGINSPTVQHTNTNNIRSPTVVIDNNNVQIQHNNQINPMALIDNTPSAPVTAVSVTSTVPLKKSRAKPKPQTKVKVQEVNVINNILDVASHVPGTSIIKTNNSLMYDQSNHAHINELSNYNVNVSQVSPVSQNNSSLQSSQDLQNVSNCSSITGTPVRHISSPVSNINSKTSQPLTQAEQTFQTHDIPIKGTIPAQLGGNEGLVENTLNIAQISDPSHQIEESKQIIVAKPEEQIKEEDRPTRPRFIAGFVHICTHCGICTDDLHQCIRCKSRIPNDSKIIKDNWGTKAHIPMTSSSLPSSPVVSKGQTDSVKQETLKRGHTRKIKSETTTTPRRRGGGRRLEECIVLSSDEEDEPKAKILKPENEVALATSSPSSKSPSKSGNPLVTKSLQINLLRVDVENPRGNPITDSGSVKPSTPKKIFNMTPLTPAVPLRPESDTDPEEVIEAIESMMGTSAPSGSYTTVACRSIRIGDYKNVAASGVQPSFKVVFHQKGIIFTLPHAEKKTQLIKCAIPTDKILHMAAHFRQRLPVVFLYTGPKYAIWLRKKLGLAEDSSNSPYYCYLNGGTCQKYITFLADEFKDSDVGVMKTTYGKILQEIDYIRANDLLMKITPDVSNNIEVITKSQTQTTGTVPPKGSSLTSTTDHVVVSTGVGTTDAELIEVDCSENKQLLSYEGMAICQNDVLCLAFEQFLNDSILDFWMRYIEHEILSPADRARTYMFSTFFYKRLTTRPKRRAGNEEDPNLSNAEKRHARVKRWTKKVDIFEKDFIFIPINENAHWFMAVICYPGLMGVHNLETGEPIPDYNKRRGKGKGKAGMKTIVKTDQCNGDNGSGSTSQKDNCVPNLDLTDQTNSKASEVGKVRIKQPCILVLDSLAGETRSRVYSTLREYLKMEFKTRKNIERDFNKVWMPGVMPNVPQQPNHCDCGIFTLYYVECFFKKPIRSFDIPIEDAIPEWKKIRWEGKREEIYNVVRQLVEKQNPECLPFVPNLTFPPLKVIKAKEIEKLKEQIDSTPIETVQKVDSSDEPMDIDVNTPSDSSEESFTMNETISGGGSVNNSSLTMPGQSCLLKPSIVEMTAASPTDNDHDHDYAPIPHRSKPV